MGCWCVKDRAVVEEPHQPDGSGMRVRVRRVGGGPIVTAEAVRAANADLAKPKALDKLAGNINGPSLIRVPDWMVDKLPDTLPADTRYLLYFAHHKGAYVEMAVAPSVEGPYTVLGMDVGTDVTKDRLSWNPSHVASPDVHVRDGAQELVMFFHAPYSSACGACSCGQKTFCATSEDGVHWDVQEAVVTASPYLRVVPHVMRDSGETEWIGVAKAPGNTGLAAYRAQDMDGPWAPVGDFFIPGGRHTALWVQDHRMHLFYSRVGDSPERIKLITVNLSDPQAAGAAGVRCCAGLCCASCANCMRCPCGARAWTDEQQDTASTDVLWPEEEWEGAQEENTPSSGGKIHDAVNQLRDPAIFHDVHGSGATYLLYSTAGESGLGMAEIAFDDAELQQQ